MTINFVGNYKTGYVGEVSDETHLARELEALGHKVNRVPRDIWKAFVDGETPNKDWVLPIPADINLIAKWDAFNDGRYISELRVQSRAGSGSPLPPVFYWVWDYMYDNGFPEWHIKMVQEADLYLSGEAGVFDEYKKLGARPYYFQMDVCDGEIPRWLSAKKYDVVFTGSCIGQGNRKEWLQEINKVIPIKIFGWGYEEWQKLGFDAEPPVYGEDYNRLIARSKLVLGFNVEPNCWGYWSNRVGKVIRAGGFLLQEYAPGMEQLLSKYPVIYFNSPQEAIEQIKKFQQLYPEGITEEPKAWPETTSADKAVQLEILMERYLKGEPSKWNKLPNTI